MHAFSIALTIAIVVSFSAVAQQNTYSTAITPTSPENPVPLPERPRARPPPPTAPSIQVPQQPAAAKPKPKAAPKALQVETPEPRNTDAYVVLVRSVIAALQHANATGNYSILRALATPELQAKLTPEEFGSIFYMLRFKNIDLSPALVMAPQFTEVPRDIPKGKFRLAGYFPTHPLKINFIIIFRAVDERWRFDALSVSTAESDTAKQVPERKESPPEVPAPAPARFLAKANKAVPRKSAPDPSTNTQEAAKPAQQAKPVAEDNVVPLPMRRPDSLSRQRNLSAAGVATTAPLASANMRSTLVPPPAPVTPPTPKKTARQDAAKKRIAPETTEPKSTLKLNEAPPPLPTRNVPVDAGKGTSAARRD